MVAHARIPLRKDGLFITLLEGVRRVWSRGRSESASLSMARAACRQASKVVHQSIERDCPRDPGRGRHCDRRVLRRRSVGPPIGRPSPPAKTDPMNPKVQQSRESRAVGVQQGDEEAPCPQKRAVQVVVWAKPQPPPVRIPLRNQGFFITLPRRIAGLAPCGRNPYEGRCQTRAGAYETGRRLRGGWSVELERLGTRARGGLGLYP